RGLAGAVSLVSRNLGGGENLTVAQAHELQANGWEILCHSRTHEDNLSTASKAFRVFSSETAGAKEDLETLGFNVQSFQQPGSWTGRYYIDRAEKLDSRAGRLLKETFAAVFAFVPYDLWNHLRPLPVLERYGGALAGGDTMTLDTLRGVVDNAVKYGALAHFRFHSNNIGGSSMISEAGFTSFLDYVRDKVDAGLLTNLTPTAAMFATRGDASTNLLGDGSFEQSTTTAFRHWERTGSPTIQTGPQGKYLAGIDQANHVSQFLRSENLRSLRFEGLARGASAGSATARVVARFADGAGSSVAEVEHRAPVGDWTKVRFTLGSHPGARYLRLWLYHTGSGAPLEWDEVRLTRI
ncbi:MAG TPA: hypothetical protein VEU29_03925, partial [Actinomycetota bacterium]|nr:hypothetical protein [Actinomycetota bacterium]